jgi:hypothetical protein
MCVDVTGTQHSAGTRPGSVDTIELINDTDNNEVLIIESMKTASSNSFFLSKVCLLIVRWFVS